MSKALQEAINELSIKKNDLDKLYSILETTNSELDQSR